jgi:hypothetical protein
MSAVKNASRTQGAPDPHTNVTDEMHGDLDFESLVNAVGMFVQKSEDVRRVWNVGHFEELAELRVVGVDASADKTARVTQHRVQGYRAHAVFP